MKVLAVIGARAESKGIRNKNIKLLAGRPLMAWVIETAIKSKYIDRVAVSTDSVQYIEIAKECGAEAPFLRPAELATDSSLEFDYVKHAVSWYKNHDFKPDIVVRLQATNPLQLPEDVDACVEKLMEDPNAHASMVIAQARQNPQKAVKIVKDDYGDEVLVSYITESVDGLAPSNRQSHDKAYFRANIVATRVEALYRLNSQIGNRVKFHVIPQERGLDIDSAIDFEIAEILIKKYR